MPKIRRSHVEWFLAGVALQFLAALVNRQIFGIVNPISWLIPPLYFFQRCNDPQFGNGRRFHWVRQTLLIVGAAATLIVGIAPPMFNLFHH